MYCSNCKTKIKENDKYCIRCGKIFDKEYFLNSEEFDIEKKLLKEIIKYDKFNESFSKKFLLLNFVYAFYRKQYFIGCVNFLNVFILIKTLINIPLIMALFAFPIIGIVVVYSLMIMYYYISNFDRIFLFDVWNP